MFKAIGTRLAALVLVGLAVALSAARLEAAGFALFEQGSKGNAMGGAFVATADDPSAMFYNPAGNAFIDDFTMLGGAFGVVRPTARLDGQNPFPGEGYSASMNKALYWFGHGYGVLPLGKDVRLSAGFWSPNGLGVPWENPDTFRGRYINQRVDLRQLSVGLQLAWKLSDSIAIGAGPEFRFTDVKLSKNVAAVNPFTQRVVDVAHTSLITTGTPVKVTWAAGLLVKPCDRLRFGASYHAHVDVDVEGYAQFGQIPTGNAQFDAAVAQQLPFGKLTPGPHDAPVPLGGGVRPRVRRDPEAHARGGRQLRHVEGIRPDRPLHRRASGHGPPARLAEHVGVPRGRALQAVDGRMGRGGLPLRPDAAARAPTPGRSCRTATGRA